MKMGRVVRQECCLSPIPLNLYSEYFTKKTLQGFGDCTIGGDVFRTMKCADYLVLLAKAERCYRACWKD